MRTFKQINALSINKFRMFLVFLLVSLSIFLPFTILERFALNVKGFCQIFLTFFERNQKAEHKCIRLLTALKMK